jgi:hypothetical protein
MMTATVQVGANKDKSVTKVSSMGMWVPVHSDEWDGGELPVEVGGPTMDSEPGEVIFRGGALPWKIGTYEVRMTLHETVLCDPTGVRSAITTMGNTTLWLPQSR